MSGAAIILTDRMTWDQQCFRMLLNGFSYPGRVQVVEGQFDAPAMSPAMAAIAQTLVDGTVRIWLDPQFAAARPWIEHHCGCHETDRQAAEIAFAASPIDLAAYRTGNAEHPELGATLVAKVTALGRGQTVVLRGPGIEDVRTLKVDGLPPYFDEEWTANAESFPCGIDLVLCAGNRFVVLPRTTRVERR